MKDKEARKNLKDLHDNTYKDFFALNEKVEDMQEEILARVEALESRMDKSAAFGSKGIQDSFRLGQETASDLKAWRSATQSFASEMRNRLERIEKNQADTSLRLVALEDAYAAEAQCEAPDCLPEVTPDEPAAAENPWPRVVTGKAHGTLVLPPHDPEQGTTGIIMSSTAAEEIDQRRNNVLQLDRLRASNSKFLADVVNVYRMFLSEKDAARLLDIADDLEEN